MTSDTAIAVTTAVTGRTPYAMNSASSTSGPTIRKPSASAKAMYATTPPSVTRKATTWRGERSQGPPWNSGCAARCRSPLTIRMTAQAARPAATSPGKSPGPTFWPGMGGNAGTCTSTAIASASSTAPKAASLNFMRSTDGLATSLLRHAERLHDRAHVGVAFRHVFPERILRRPRCAESPVRQEILVVLAVVGFLDRGDEPRLDVFRHALWRGKSAPRGGRPVAAGRLLDRRERRIQRRRLIVENGERTHLAGIDQ